METILEITDVENILPNGSDRYNTCDGYKIKTDKQEILLLISNGQSCCEQWGYFISNDDFKDFIGATITEIKAGDTNLNLTKLVDTYDGDSAFVNIETNKGTLQFVAYNSHNGYYGHSYYIVSNQYKDSGSL